jgi:hypothetical protein
LKIVRRQILVVNLTELWGQKNGATKTRFEWQNNAVLKCLRAISRVGSVTLFTVLRAVVAKYRKLPLLAPNRTKALITDQSKKL